jgi:hypothetical protein
MNTLKGDRLPGISVVISQVLPGWVEDLHWIFFDLDHSSQLRVLNLQKGSKSIAAALVAGSVKLNQTTPRKP